MAADWGRKEAKERQNGANGASDIEGEVARVAASRLGKRRVSIKNQELGSGRSRNAENVEPSVCKLESERTGANVRIWIGSRVSHFVCIECHFPTIIEARRGRDQ